LYKNNAGSIIYKSVLDTAVIQMSSAQATYLIKFVLMSHTSTYLQTVPT